MYRNSTPRIITAKYTSKCAWTSKCQNTIKPGDKVLYYPREKSCACASCTDQARRELAAADFDERQYNSGY